MFLLLYLLIDIYNYMYIETKHIRSYIHMGDDEMKYE